MKSSRKYLLLLFLLLIQLPALAQLRLPRLISDGMILQRNKTLNVWGWANPDEQVQLSFGSITYVTRANSKGEWKIQLPPQPAGGPYSMVVSTVTQSIRVNDILFGDVWICSGQSNMELTMQRVSVVYDDIIATSENPEIRQFLVPDQFDFKTTSDDLESGSWIAATPETIMDFSAVAYFFARELNETYGIPIGLINTALGGSPVEAWMSEETLTQFPDAYEEMQRFKNDALIDSIQQAEQQRSDSWYSEINQKDAGLNADPSWSEPTADDSGWKITEVPGYWSETTNLGQINGSVWFRRDIQIPDSMAGKEARLWMGRIVDQDYVYVNGKQVGFTSYQYPPRRYTVSEGILKPGKNTIAVRVINSAGEGGFVPDKPYFLSTGKDTIDLKGTWKYKLGTTMEELPSKTFILGKPGGLYNKMIAPLTNYTIAGVIWYQGESNTEDGEPELYDERFRALINNWRRAWGQGRFPFLYVQLANFMEPSDEPAESNWAELRQAQLNTLTEPNTGMAVTIDIGEWNDIHPLNKKDVGNRLALLAEKLALGNNDVVASGPLIASARRDSGKVILKFNHIGSGLMAKGEELNGFALADSTGDYHWASAEIQGDRIVVWHQEITQPSGIRYAWADNPVNANLYNQEGLPASPFQILFEDE